MKKIEDADKNLKVSTTLEEKDIAFFDVSEPPFDIYGIMHTDTGFCRVPKAVADNVNDGVKFLSTNTAGGRVRFKTDSPYVAISAKMPYITRFAHMPLTGIAGFDMYIYESGECRFAHTYVPPYDMTNGYDSIYYFKTGGEHEIVLNFPLYNDVSSLLIGVKEGSSLSGGGKYIDKKPVVYYGSSITQGGCASRPGNSYQAIISRALDCDYINLGFSGSARAEDAIAEYIAELDMSCFVYDYDHNAPDAAHLEKTHEKMFKTIRTAQPNLPIIMVTMPLETDMDEIDKRREIIYRTYRNALDGGDKNVYFINGYDFYKMSGDSGTVDGCHPNDLGFWQMADTMLPIIRKVLGL